MGTTQATPVRGRKRPHRQGPSAAVGRWFAPLWIAVLLAVAGGCYQDMEEQPRIDPLEASPLPNRISGARQPVPGTVARGHSIEQAALYDSVQATGRNDEGQLVSDLPQSITEGQNMQALLERGRQRYEIFCSHCHDLIGSGNGRVPQRGYPFPPTFHSDRLRNVPLGYFYDVITNGRGRMPAHRNLVDASDRWRISAYIRALQFSQYALVDRLPESVQQELEKQTSQAQPPQG